MTLGEAIKNLKNKLAKVFYTIGDEIAGGSPFRGELSRDGLSERARYAESRLWSLQTGLSLHKDRAAGFERALDKAGREFNTLLKDGCSESYRRGYDQAVYDMRGKEK